MADASECAVGAVLQQDMGDGWRPIAFFSRKLGPAERKCSTFDRELLAVYLTIKHFRYFVEGREFFILTDHKPLHLLSQPIQTSSTSAKFVTSTLSPSSQGTYGM
jgi:hypothetical protein